MIPQVKNISILFLLLSLFLSVSAQDYSRNDRTIVFTDSANVREEATLNSNIVSVLRHGTELIICNKGHTKDTVNGKWGRWIPILNGNTTGYMWEHTLADIAETHENGNTLLARNSSEGFAYKIIRDKNLLKQGTFADSSRLKFTRVMQMDIDTVADGVSSFRILDSPNLYAFDGTKVYRNGTCNLSEANDFHSNFTKTFNDYLGVVVLDSNTSLMIAPNPKSQLLASIPQYSFVEATSAPPFQDTINGKAESWNRVKWQGQTGYILNKSLGYRIHHIYDHEDTTQSYLLTRNALLVLQNRKPIAHTPTGWYTYDNKLHSFGDMGYGKGNNFIAMEFVAHSCGQTSGDKYFLWDGKSIKFFCFSSGVGDGDFSEYDGYVFPKNHTLGNNIIIHQSSASEGIRIEPVNDCESHFTDVDDYEYTSLMQFVNDTLVEIDSEYLQARKFVEKQLPDQSAIRIMLYDINKDGLDDLIFQSSPKPEANSFYDYGGINDLYHTTLGIAFATSSTQFELKAVNNTVVSGRMDKRIQWDYNNDILTIKTFYISREYRHDSYPAYSRKNYTFQYDETDGNFYWKSVTIMNKQGINHNSFKTKKVLFENAWPFEVDDDY